MSVSEGQFYTKVDFDVKSYAASQIPGKNIKQLQSILLKCSALSEFKTRDKVKITIDVDPLNLL